MRAAFLKTKNLKFEIRDIDIPKIHSGESLLHVETVGVCGTDLKEYRRKYETWKTWRKFAQSMARRVSISPYNQKELRLGHEICGFVEETNSPVLTRTKKVVVFPDVPCGECWACQQGLETVCSNFKNIGFERAGGFAEYVVVPDTNLLSIPDDLDSSTATLAEPLACALHAIEMAKLEKGNNVLVAGVGPIGLLITFICKKEFSSTISACDYSSFRLEVARKMGASNTLTPNDFRSQNLFADVVFDCTGGLAQLLDPIVEIIRPHGTICIEGFYDEIQHFRLRRLQKKEAKIFTSQGNNQKNRQEAIVKIQRYANELKGLVTHLYPLEKISQAFETAIRSDQNRAVKVVIKP